MNKGELIDEISKQVFYAKKGFYHVNGPDKKPEIVVFMDSETYIRCKSFIRGVVSTAAIEFVERDTIQGYPIFEVIPSARDDRKAPPFTVVILND